MFIPKPLCCFAQVSLSVDDLKVCCTLCHCDVSVCMKLVLTVIYGDDISESFGLKY